MASKRFNQIKAAVNGYKGKVDKLLVEQKYIDITKKSFKRITGFKDKKDIKKSLVDDNFLESLKMVCKLYSELYSKNSSVCSKQYKKVEKRIKKYKNRLKKCSKTNSKNFLKILRAKNWKLNDLSDSLKSEMFTAAHRLFNAVEHFKECLESVDETNSVLSNAQTSVTKESVSLKDNCLEYLGVTLLVLDFEKRRFTIKLEKVNDNEFIYTQKEDKSKKEFEFFKNYEQCIAKLWNTDWQAQLSDVKQGKIGDCYLMTALQTIIQTSPQAIKDVFVKYDKETSTVTLSFYKVHVTVNKEVTKLVAKQNGKIKIKIDASIMKLGNLGVNENKSAVWVNLIEKAYVIYKREGITHQKGLEKLFPTSLGNKYDVADIVGGYSIIPMTAITGKRSEITLPKEKAEPTSTKTVASEKSESVDTNTQSSIAAPLETAVDSLESFEVFKEALDAKKVIVVDTKSGKDPVWKNNYVFQVIEGNEIKDEPCDGNNIIYDGHAHSVKKVENDNNIILLNPHMNEGYKITNATKQNNEGKIILRAKIIAEKGELHMDLEIFKTFFFRYHIGKTKSSKSIKKPPVP